MHITTPLPFATLLARYRRQSSDLEAAQDQDDIVRLVSDSQATLTDLAGTRVDTVAALADKTDALIERYANFGSLPMDHVRELLLDARGLATPPLSAWDRALGSYRTQAEAVDRIIGRESHTDDELADAQRTRNSAMADLFATPAPTIAALAIKMDMLAGDLRDFEPDETMIAHVVADTHRLAKQEG